MKPNFKPLRKTRKLRKLHSWSAWILFFSLSSYIAFQLHLNVISMEIYESDPTQKIWLQQFTQPELGDPIWINLPWSQNWQEMKSIGKVQFSSNNAEALARFPLSKKPFELIRTADSLSDTLIYLPQGAAALRVWKGVKDSLNKSWIKYELVDPRVKELRVCLQSQEQDTICVVEGQGLWQKF